MGKAFIALHWRKGSRIVAGHIYCFDIGAGAQQGFDVLAPVEQGAHYDRGLVCDFAQVRLRAGGHQAPGDRQMPVEREPHQRADTRHRAFGSAPHPSSREAVSSYP